MTQIVVVVVINKVSTHPFPHCKSIVIIAFIIVRLSRGSHRILRLIMTHYEVFALNLDLYTLFIPMLPCVRETRHVWCCTRSRGVS
jgi:hypothetical protein